MASLSSIKKSVQSLLVMLVLHVLAKYCPVAMAVTALPTWKPPTTAGLSGTADIALQHGDRFFAYDNLGVPSFAFTDGNHIRLSRLVPGVGWVARIVASPLTGDANGAAIAFDRRERPAISYGDSDGLHYVSFDPLTGTFSDTLVDDSSISGHDYTVGGTSIAFDRIGRPAIAAVGSSGPLRFITDDDGDGSLSTSDTVETAVSFNDQRPSLTFDPLNHPIIGGIEGNFADVSVKDPFVGWRTSTASTVLGGGVDTTSVANVSIAIDPDDGLPAVAWTDQSPGQLYYSKWNPVSGAWFPELVDVASLGAELGNESLAFDPGDGNPAISYSDEAGNVFFAYHDGIGWNTQFVHDTSTSAPVRTSLDFNEFGDGFPAIGYIDSLGTVRFLVDPPIAVAEPSSVVLLLAAAIFFFRRRCVTFASCRESRRRHIL